MPRLSAGTRLALLALHARDGALTFLAWWTAELRGLVPPVIAHFFQDKSSSIVLRPSADKMLFETGSGVPLGQCPAQGGGVLPPAITSPLRESGHLTAHLPAATILRRVIELPLAASTELAAAISFEIDRQTPFTPEQIYSAFRIVGREPARKSILVEMAVVPRRAVDRITAFADAGKLALDSITIEGDNTIPALEFLPRTRRRIGRSWRAEPWKPLLAATLLLFLAGLTGIAWHAHSVATQLVAEVAAKRQASQHAEMLAREWDAAIRLAGFLPEKLAMPRTIEIVDTLSKTVPDDSWVFDLEIDATDIHLTGFSKNVPTLIEHLQNAGAFGPTQFRSPVLHRNDASSDHFDLAVTFKKPAA